MPEHFSDNLFLIVHDEFTGKLRVSHDLLECGLVAAQLAELIVAGWLSIPDDRVTVTDLQGSGGDAEDAIAAFVIESVQRQRERHTVRTWIGTFDGVMSELVARRLVDSGVLRRESNRQLMRRRPDRFPAVDLLGAARPRIRLEHMLRTPKEFDLAGAITAALVGVLGVDSVLDPELDRSAMRDLVGQLRGHLPTDLQSLLEGTAAAVAAISLTVRR